MTDAQRQRIVDGIAAYAHEQRAILRLLRKRGQFRASEFDAWLTGREWRRPRLRAQGISGDSFILGIGLNGGSMWGQWLDLLQHMMHLGLVETRVEDGEIIYVGVV